MCLFPKLILNKKYMPTKKNNYTPPLLRDARLQFVPVGCGNCIECRKQKARTWQVRLHEEIKSNNEKPYFATLSFSDESLDKLCEEFNKKESNGIASVAVRRFCERYRKRYKHSIKHWLIPELGHQNTERLHLHGIIWTNAPREDIERIWSYGNIWLGEYCNAKTINYIVKYITKIDTDHKGFIGQIFCSAGIGGRFRKSHKAKEHKYRGLETRDYYRLDSGSKINMPIYYRNALYSEEEREQLWLQRLDTEKRYVMGIEYDISTEKGYQRYYKAVLQAQRENRELGYGDDSDEWSWKPYNVRARTIQKETKARKIRKVTRTYDELKEVKITSENLQE